MNKTILSSKQSDLLEKLIEKYGLIVTSAQIIQTASGNWDYKQAKNVITKLTRDGWLIRIKRGLYTISDLGGRGFLSLSSYLVANLLGEGTYVSGWAALQYHNMFDQLLNQTICVGQKTYITTSLGNMTYRFIKTKKELVCGYEEVDMDNKKVRIATAEKGLVDIIHFERSKLSVDEVIEKMLDYRSDLSFEKIIKYASGCSVATKKVLGLIFDLLGIDSGSLYGQVMGSKSTHWMLAGDKKFNAKWRMYYDEHFDKYKQAIV